MKELKLTYDDVHKSTLNALGNIQTPNYSDVIGIATGGMIPATIVAKNLDNKPTLHCVHLSSYGDKKKSSGVITQQTSLEYEKLEERVLLVDDLIQTGLTLLHMSNNIRNYAKNVTTIDILVLYNKENKTLQDFPFVENIYWDKIATIDKDEWIIFPWEQ